MLIEFVDQAGEWHTRQVDAPYAEACARVLADDLGMREVRVGGQPPGGPCREHHRRLFEIWQTGSFLEEAGDGGR